MLIIAPLFNGEGGKPEYVGPFQEADDAKEWLAKKTEARPDLWRDASIVELSPPYAFGK